MNWNNRFIAQDKFARNVDHPRNDIGNLNLTNLLIYKI